jgi:hypothetical protein
MILLLWAMLPSRTLGCVFGTDGCLQTLDQSLQSALSVSCSIDGVVTLLGSCVPSPEGILYT